MHAGRFAQRLIAWQKSHGRHHLPWQGGGAYATWVSEIMLQQTQVASAIPYYRRFLARFPDVASLAAVCVEEVLSYWSGLGYYSRARNLHRTARLIVTAHGGVFPHDFERILAFPGIGRSTAGAICALAYGQRRAILDGNARRVFARHFAIAGWAGEAAVEKLLWQRAEAELPAQDMAVYTQGLMDLGATACLRARPRCQICPVAASCEAHRQGREAEYPAPRPARTLAQKCAVWMVCVHGGEVLLEKRPLSGLWGGLWAFPEAAGEAEQAARTLLGRAPDKVQVLPRRSHSFTHFRLTASPVRMDYAERPALAGEDRCVWLSLSELETAPLPKPVKTLLEKLR